MPSVRAEVCGRRGDHRKNRIVKVPSLRRVVPPTFAMLSLMVAETDLQLVPSLFTQFMRMSAILLGMLSLSRALTEIDRTLTVRDSIQ